MPKAEARLANTIPVPKPAHVNAPETDSPIVVTQWGGESRAFRSFSADERTLWLTELRNVVERLREQHGIETFLSYGGLLGAVRDGQLIGHDFDLDLCFVCPPPPHSRATVERLLQALTDDGFEIRQESNGQMACKKMVGDHAFSFDLFVCWRVEEQFFMYFAVPGAPIADDIFPLSEIMLEGVTFPAPRRPEVLLEATYGENWRIPDPDFRYDIQAEAWLPFKAFFINKNNDYWDSYYGAPGRTGIWSVAPSQFAAFCMSELPQGMKLLDFGCGNGRDGLFFASGRHDVTLADYSQAAVDGVVARADSAGLDIEAVQVDIANPLTVVEFTTDREGVFDVVYARFFLHAIDLMAELAFLDMAKTLLKPGGQVMVEFRNDRDPRAQIGKSLSEDERVDGHYRRFIKTDEFLERAAAAGFTSKYAFEGQGLARFKEEDPVVTRVVLVSDEAPA